jgi:hypothetical protein
MRGGSECHQAASCGLLHYYKVELHHLAPNSISQAAIFVAVCEGYLGMEPQWNLWLYLFRAEHFAKKGE